MNNEITYNSSSLEQLIHNRFGAPGYAFIPQVRDGTGSNFSRTADALAMSLWPYRGLSIYGFEIKVNRIDWLNELRQPEKAEAVACYCDFWYVVAPKDLIKLDEIPATWGLMVPFGSTLKAVKKAEQLKPKPMDKSFVAAILRRATQYILPESKIKEAYESGKAEANQRANERLKYKDKELHDLEDGIREFENASGILIRYGWDKKKIGAAVNVVLNGEHLHIKDKLERMLKEVDNISQVIKNEIAVIK